MQRAAGLAQREVERRGLERPVAEAPRAVPRRRLRPELERGEVLAEARQRPLALERQRGSSLVAAWCRPRGDRTSSPSPSAPAPTSRTCVVKRSNSYASAACSRSYSHASTTSGNPATRDHNDSPVIAAPQRSHTASRRRPTPASWSSVSSIRPFSRDDLLALTAPSRRSHLSRVAPCGMSRHCVPGSAPRGARLRRGGRRDRAGGGGPGHARRVAAGAAG